MGPSKFIRQFTSIANRRDSAVKVFKADNSEATGIQKLGQILHLKDKSNKRFRSTLTMATQRNSSPEALFCPDASRWCHGKMVSRWHKQKSILKNNQLCGLSMTWDYWQHIFTVLLQNNLQQQSNFCGQGKTNQQTRQNQAMKILMCTKGTVFSQDIIKAVK